MKVIGCKISVKGMEFMKMMMDINIKGNGWGIYRMDKELKICRMVPIIVDSLKMGWNTGKDIQNGKINPNIMANG